MPLKKPTNVAEYIAGFPAETQVLLKQMRETIQKAVPEATESISYGMPAFKLNAITIWFAAYKKHIGLYPMYGLDNFKDEIEMYKGKGTKDTLQFPYHKPLPLALIAKIIKYKMELK